MQQEKQTQSRSSKRRKKKSPPVSLLYCDQIQDLPALVPEKVFFTADTHFYGVNAWKHRRRFPDLETMNEVLIRNWNETVPEDGVVFHLGDLATGLPVEQLIGLVNRLNGTILLVKGNHDDIGIFRCSSFQKNTRLRLLGYHWEMRLGGKKILMDHYPLLCYADEYKGVWQLFGHVHSGPDADGHDIPRLRHLLPFQYDVGVDNNNDKPVSFYRLKEIMNKT